MPECPMCGSDIEIEDSYCPECGTNLKEDDSYSY